MKRIFLNDKFVAFTALDIDYLDEKKWDNEIYLPLVRRAKVVTTDTFSAERARIISNGGGTQSAQVDVTSSNALRIVYSSLDDPGDRTSFSAIARWAGCMDNIKANVPRTAYKGVVSIWKDGIKLHLTPYQV